MMTMDIPNIFALGISTTKGTITDLGLDPYLIGQISDHLKDRFQMVPVIYHSPDFRADRLKPSIGEVIRQKTSLPAGGPQSVDAYIVATTANIEVQNTGRHVRGAFLAKLPALGKDDYYAGVVYTMTVIDGHDFKTLADISIHDYDGVAESYWTEDIDKMTPKQRGNLKDELQSQLSATVRPALKRLPFVE
jgi:hypothetical protein